MKSNNKKNDRKQVSSLESLENLKSAQYTRTKSSMKALVLQTKTESITNS